MPGYPGFVLAVEDARINSGLEAIGLGLHFDAAELEEIARLSRSDLRHGEFGLVFWALRTMAATGTNAAERLFRVLDRRSSKDEPSGQLAREVRDRVVRAREKIVREAQRDADVVCRPETAVLIALWLRRQLLGLGLVEPPASSWGTGCCHGRSLRFRPGRGGNGRGGRGGHGSGGAEAGPGPAS